MNVLIIALDSVTPVQVTNANVLVVAPALNSRLHRWLSDEDDARRQAAERLSAWIERLQLTVASVQGTVGDADPLQAIADALATFAADEIVIARESDRPTQLADELVSRVSRRFGLPVRPCRGSFLARSTRRGRSAASLPSPPARSFRSAERGGAGPRRGPAHRSAGELGDTPFACCGPSSGAPALPVPRVRRGRRTAVSARGRIAAPQLTGGRPMPDGPIVAIPNAPAPPFPPYPPYAPFPPYPPYPPVVLHSHGHCGCNCGGGHGNAPVAVGPGYSAPPPYVQPGQAVPPPPPPGVANPPTPGTAGTHPATPGGPGTTPPAPGFNPFDPLGSLLGLFGVPSPTGVAGGLLGSLFGGGR